MRSPDPEPGLPGLRAALSKFSCWYDEEPGNHLPAMIYCLGAVLEFLRGSAVEAGYLRPLRHLFMALDTLNAGRVAPVLAPKSVGANPRSQRSGAVMFKRAMVLIIWEALYSGLGKVRGDKRRADALTSEILNREGVLPDRGASFTADIIRQWRSDASPRGPGEEIGKSVEEFVTGIPSGAGLAAAKRGARELARVLREFPGLEVSTDPQFL
jgi:hypothetical protein